MNSPTQKPISYSLWALCCSLTALIFLSPLVFSDFSAWGFDYFKFLPDGFHIGAALLILLTLAASLFSRRHSVILETFAGQAFLARIPRVVKYISVFTIAVAVFFWFRQSTHFLGDGYQWIALYGESDNWYMRSVKFTELGSSYVIRAMQALLGSYKKSTAEMAFQIVAALSGGVVFLYVLALSRQFFNDRLQRFSFLLLIFATPALALFFGYVEFYPFLWAAVSVLIFYSVKCLKGETPEYVVLALFALAC
ncbi:MAG: hypothetical protein IIB00_05920, partial [candidate division Zixibacteria bacterium]|nr:hypothetical protein [candidate division Zixibacteria bacterium]